MPSIAVRSFSTAPRRRRWWTRRSSKPCAGEQCITSIGDDQQRDIQPLARGRPSFFRTGASYGNSNIRSAQLAQQAQHLERELMSAPDRDLALREKGALIFDRHW